MYGMYAHRDESLIGHGLFDEMRWDYIEMMRLVKVLKLVTVPYRDESISILGVLLSQVLKLVKVLFWIWGKLLREEIVLSCFRAKIHIDLRWKVNRVFWYMHCFSVQCNEIQLLFCAFLSLSLMCDGRTPSSIPISILLIQGTTHPTQILLVYLA